MKEVKSHRSAAVVGSVSVTKFPGGVLPHTYMDAPLQRWAQLSPYLDFLPSSKRRRGEEQIHPGHIYSSQWFIKVTYLDNNSMFIKIA